MSLNVGVIGCGNISRFHFSGLAKAGANITWVCDLEAARANARAAETAATATTDWRQVIADPAVQVVDVIAVSRVHREICLAAIDAGKAVICEKTLAENPDDAAAIVRRALDAGTIFYTSYMKRFIPAVEKAKELLPSLGRIITTHIRAHQPWGDLWTAAPTEGFCHTPPGGTSPLVRNYGGGILVCGGSHILDLVNFFHGRPYRLFAHLVEPEGRDYDILAAALFETDRGPVHYETVAHPLNRVGFLRDGWDERVEIIGVNGRLEVFSAKWDEVDAKASVLVHYDNATGAATEYRYAPESPFDRAIGCFCANIERGEQGAQSALSGYEVDELIGAIKTSGREHRAVEVPWRL